ncbi:MAG: hypothetical protein F6J97_10220 [Leptolyngbya sp. SIO4C1]|nr:hypothetical protein [Leptolyngbya sp. SIO4C1]
MFQPNDAGANTPPISFDQSPQFESVRLSITGSRAGLRKIVNTLHKLHFAEPNDWSEPQPKGDDWVTVLIRRLRVD